MYSGSSISSVCSTFILTPSGKFLWMYSRNVSAVSSVKCRNYRREEKNEIKTSNNFQASTAMGSCEK